MFEKFFDCSWRINTIRNGPGGLSLVGFADKLCQQNYAEITARKHIRAAEHFIYWSDSRGISVSSLTDKSLEHFDRHLGSCRCPGYGHSNRMHLLNGASLFLKFLQDAGVIERVDEPVTKDPELLTSFCQWMRQQRGTSDKTLYNYSLPIRDLLESLGDDPIKFNTHRLGQFVLKKSQNSGWAAMKQCTTGLRMFLRFLIAEGRCATGMDAAIPAVAHWRLSSLPRYLQPEDVERIISSCDTSLPVGKRDRAILLLLARLAFRASDILHLRLDDINWEAADIQVTGKGRRQTRLPLSQEIGDAIVEYLRDGRPPTDTDVLFIRSRAPFRAFTTHSSISVIVSRAMRRADVACQSRGAAHILRHSAATSMLRQGASLQEIADILRHQSIETTQIYAKVDVSALSQIAQPWPEVPSC